MRVPAFLAALLLAACAPVPVPVDAQAQPYSGLTSEEQAAKAYAVELGNNGCSATKIGPHALLTATHCVDDDNPSRKRPEVLLVDDKSTRVKKFIDDGKDHTIMIVNDTYKTWASMAAPPPVGATVFFWGNSEFDDLFRRGVVCGYYQMDLWKGVWADAVMVLDIMFSGGDSGSGLFNEQGYLVGVASAVHMWDDRGQGAMGQVGLATPFNFELKDIKDHVGGDPRYLLGD